MTREEYINKINNNEVIEICYIFYKESALKQNKFYHDEPVFYRLFSFWRHARYCIDEVIKYYNKIFDVRTLEFKNQIIKYI